MIRLGGFRIYIGKQTQLNKPLFWFGIGWKGDWFIGLMVSKGVIDGSA